MFENVKFKFEGKRALVTGGARGIGKGIALALAASGAETFVFDINKDGLDVLKQECPSVHPISVDLRDWAATRAAVESIVPLDFVVNDAGILIEEHLLDIKLESLDQTLSVNTKAVLNICQVVTKDLIERKKPGAIVNISSTGSLLPIPNCTSYNVSKAAVNMITKSIATEVGQHQIRINSVLPTLVTSEMGRRVWGNEEASQACKSRIALGRFCEVRDIVGPVLFLLSDAASMIHGHQLLVDGGNLVT